VTNPRGASATEVPLRRMALLTALAVVLGLATVLAGSARADEGTISVDNARTAWDQNEPGLSPASVGSSDFGQLFSTRVDGQIYAQPLSAAGMLIVATENDKVYGLNPVTGAISWTRDVGPFWPASSIGCGDLTPNIGVTSTPVYDPSTRTVYLTSKTNDGPDPGAPHWYMHALDVSTGSERAGWPVTIAGSPTNDQSNRFDPFTASQRPGLLLMNGVIYAGFASHCDVKPYRGYVVGVSTTAAAVTTMWAAETSASGTGAGIWQSGSGLVLDGDGSILLATGNGISPPAGAGSSPPGLLAESVVRLRVNPDRSLVATDFFSPANAPTMDLNDADLGSAGPVALPSLFGAGTSHPNLLIQGGKDGRVFLLDRDHLGGRKQGPNTTDAVVGVNGPFQGQWGHPAVWGGDGGYVYLFGSGGPLRALKYGVTGAGVPALSLAGTGAANLGFRSGSPVVTSTGTTPGSAVVWLESAGDPGTGIPGLLRAYSPVPDANGTLRQIYSAPMGPITKFSVPATDGNRVYVGNADGHVLAFGRPAQTALTGSPVTFGATPVGGTGTAQDSLTATRPVTVTAITTSAPFGVSPPALPVTLSAGQRLAVPVSYSPAAAGNANGLLSITTDLGTVGFSLSGTATQPGLHAVPTSVAFTGKPTGATYTTNVQVTNTSTSPETVRGTTGTVAPFATTGLPAAGTTVAPGGSFIATVTYTPASAGTSTSSITVTSTSGTLTIPVSGTAIRGSGNLVLSPTTTAFGSVPVGRASTQTFDISNSGNIPLTITKAKAPAGAFTSATPLAEGLVLGPGQVIHQAVTFTPTANGPVTASYEISGDGGQGQQFEQLTGNGTGGTVAGPTPPTGVTASPISANQVDLSWTGSAGVTGYNIKRSVTAGGPYTALASGIAQTTYTDTGLAAATTYYYVVSATNTSGESVNSAQASATTGAPATCASGQWQAQYYPNMTLSGTPVATQCESEINHNWGITGPGIGGLGGSNFSVRWTQTPTFRAGSYTFNATGDDGIRVLLDGTKIIDGWHDQAPTSYATTVPVSAGPHTVTVEYYQNMVGAVAIANFRPTASCAPGQWQAQYYPNMTLSGTPVASPCEDAVNHNWGTTGPGIGGLGGTNFSVRWTQTPTLSAGNYTFNLTGDDGIRLLLDGTTILDGWRDQPPASYATTVPVSAGKHTITVEYYQNGGGAVAAANYSLVTPTSTCASGQWQAQYYPNMTLSGTPVATQCESEINHNWGITGPGIGGLGGSNFSVRWTQTPTFRAGSYTFNATGDDGIRVLLDGTKIIDGWHDQAPTSYATTVPVSAGPHTVTVEYYQNMVGAVAIANFRPTASCAPGQWQAQYYPNMTLSGTPVASPCEDAVNHNWGTTGPGIGGLGGTNFSVRWTQTPTLSAGNYTFNLTGDDGIRLLLDGTTILDGWRDQPPASYATTVPVSAGKHTITVEYYQNGGGAVAAANYYRR